MENPALSNKANAVDAELDATQAPPTPEDVPPDAPAGAATPQVLSPQEEARGLIDFAIEIAKPFYPSLDGIYSPEARERLAAVTAPLLTKYNISVTQLFERWSAEINFAFVALPLMLQTIKAIKAENAVREASKKKPSSPAGAGAGASPPPAATGKAPAAPEPLHAIAA